MSDRTRSLLASGRSGLGLARRYWVHALWIIVTLFLLSIQWWLFWSYRDVDWNYGRFMLALVPFCILFVNTTLLVPTDSTDVGPWKAHPTS